eukprot:1159179-Pelagomonas_calceolata.AAC.8
MQPLHQERRNPDSASLEHGHGDCFLSSFADSPIQQLARSPTCRLGLWMWRHLLAPWTAKFWCATAVGKTPAATTAHASWAGAQGERNQGREPCAAAFVPSRTHVGAAPEVALSLELCMSATR